MVYLDVVIFALIALLVLLLISYFGAGSKTENFDTYLNHDLGAYDAYQSGFGDKMGFKPESVSDANLYARYAWSEKDSAGMDVYDEYYESYIRTNGTSNDDPEYTYRALDGQQKDSAYNERFSIRDGGNKFYNYRIGDMWDRNPARAYDFHSDEDAIIAQKNY